MGLRVVRAEVRRVQAAPVGRTLPARVAARVVAEVDERLWRIPAEMAQLCCALVQLSDCSQGLCDLRAELVCSVPAWVDLNSAGEAADLVG